MGSLTKKERDALNDIFNSLYPERKRYMTQHIQKLLIQAKNRLIQAKYSQFLLIFSKKKKNLSK